MRNLGVTYRGPGRISEYASVILAQTAISGMFSSVAEQSDGQIVLNVVQKSPGYRVAFLALPQRMRWSLTQKGGEAVISCEARLFTWYAGLIVLIALSWPMMVSASLLMAMASSSFLGVLGWGAFLFVSAPLAFVPAHLLDAYGGQQLHALWENLQSVAKREEGVLVEVSSPLAVRGTRWGLIYLVYVIAVVAGLAAALPRGSIGDILADFPILWVLLLFVLPFGFAIFMHILNRPSGLRAHLLLPGFWCLVAGLYWVLAPLPWIIVSQSAPEDLDVFETAVRVVNGAQSPHPLSAEEMGRVAEAIRMFFAIIACGVLFSLVVLGFSCLFLRHAVRLASLLGPELDRLRRQTGARRIREAVSGRGFLGVFRLIYGFSWFLGAGMVLGGILAALFCGLSAACGEWLSVPGASWVRVSQRLLSLAMTGEPDDYAVLAVVRTGWVLFAVTLVLPLLLSVGQLWNYRRAVRRDVERRTVYGSKKYQGLVPMVAELSRVYGLEPPRVSVVEKKEVNAHAHEFGWFRRTRYVEITTEAVSAFGLQGPAMRALVGHELSHFKGGHCRLLNLMRWVGRFSLVGDSFAFAFANSFGYEEKADRMAVEQLGVPRAAMLDCLGVFEKQSLGLDWDSVAATSSASDEATPESASRDSGQTGRTRDLPLLRRLRMSWEAFARQYTSPFDLAYWHPHIKDRIAALAAR